MAPSIPLSDALARLCADQWEAEATVAHPAFVRHLRHGALVLEGCSTRNQTFSAHKTIFFRGFNLNFRSGELKPHEPGRLAITNLCVPDEEIYLRILESVVASVRRDIDERWRDDLREKVDAGTMTPDDAEAMATRFGFPPFQNDPSVLIAKFMGLSSF